LHLVVVWLLLSIYTLVPFNLGGTVPGDGADLVHEGPGRAEHTTADAEAGPLFEPMTNRS
jgi:hypothetical protein